MNWFKYRLPNSTDIVSGASHTLVKGFGKGFVVAPFLNPEKFLLNIPFDFIPESHDIKAINSSLPLSTPKSDYQLEIKAIKDKLDGNRGKIVAARVIRLDISIDLNATFDSLCQSYPNAFVFSFSTSETGTWIGASPELLLRKDKEFLTTMALAGTRPCSDIDEQWDEKNLDEQAMVTEFIIDSLIKNCGTVTVGKTFTKKAGPIEHICTPIAAFMPPSELADEYEDSYINRLRQLLTELSPTPALCGSDRSQSLELIRDYEKFSREMYGGFCGPNDIEDNTAFFVNLRSAKVSKNAVAIYAGGGITPLSNSDDEWNETEMKSKTIINHLKTSEE
ncbi:MAG: chorismate-binding protein [Muribaculaceae bacterium]|nr:chorismate-binding protein [Muribaculaceae bacterium]